MDCMKCMNDDSPRCFYCKNNSNYQEVEMEEIEPDANIFDIDDILDGIADQVYSIGEGDFDYSELMEINNEQKVDLRHKLSIALNDWIVENKLEAGFGGLIDKDIDIMG